MQPIAPTPTRKEATEDRNAHTHAQDETRAPVESNQVLSVLEVSKIDRRASANATKAEKIDRLLNAKPEDFEPETHAWASHHLQHHHSAFSPHLPSRPPDRQQTAELLTAAEVLQQDERYGLLAMLEELKMARLLPGKGWGWYITVAADKCAGIPAAELKAARQQRAQARKQASAATAAAPDNPNFRADLMSGILAGAKTMPTARGARR